MTGFLHDGLAQALAERMKTLLRGMRERVNRDPDIADFKAALNDEARKWYRENLEEKKSA